MNLNEYQFIPIIINLESENYKPEDSDWQKECQGLYSQMKNALDQGTIEPHKLKLEGEGDRGGFLEIFTMITTGIASIGGLSVIVDIAKVWLESRKGSEIILKFPDGSEMKISGATKEEILLLYEKQLANKKN